jgi:Rv0078B-related antitoxin
MEYNSSMTEEQVRIYRRMSSAERVAAGCALHDFACERLLLDLRRRHPDSSEDEIQRMLVRSFLGEAAGVL